MQIDYESQNLVGAGESSTYNILKHLTGLKPQSLRDFKLQRNGIYKQVPLEWIIHKHDFNLLSDAHKKGSIDLFLINNGKKIAVRVQGKGHGIGLKGLGKAKHDKVQQNIIKKYVELVDILFIECPNVFKERVSENAVNEIISSFKTSNVLIPIARELP